MSDDEFDFREAWKEAQSTAFVELVTRCVAVALGTMAPLLVFSFFACTYGWGRECHGDRWIWLAMAPVAAAGSWYHWRQAEKANPTKGNRG